MTPRVEAEIALLRKKYSTLEIKDEASKVIVILHDYKLPPGWSRNSTDLGIVVPSGYPVTPPDNFYVRPTLRTTSQGVPASYNDDASGQGMTGWSWFSFHLQDT